jgi:uncharacterized protein (DUF2267 family)
MANRSEEKLKGYYEYIMAEGKLRTLNHARTWSDGVLKTLGTALDRGTKKSLSNQLPEELSDSLTGVFWLMHFRDPNQTSAEFLQRVARRSGNSDGEFARYPTQAVFGGLKMFIDNDLNEKIAQTLSPELRQLWQQANPVEKIPITS